MAVSCRRLDGDQRPSFSSQVLQAHSTHAKRASGIDLPDTHPSRCQPAVPSTAGEASRHFRHDERWYYASSVIDARARLGL